MPRRPRDGEAVCVGSGDQQITGRGQDARPIRNAEGQDASAWGMDEQVEWLPAGRGDEPQVLATVTSAGCMPCSSQVMAVSSISRSVL